MAESAGAGDPVTSVEQVDQLQVVYDDRRHFIAHKLNHTRCLRGRDLPADNDRQCAACMNTIQKHHAVARICPTSNKHVFHWLCMVRWLCTWDPSLQQYRRTCPTCRTMLFRIRNPLGPSEESRETQRLRSTIEASWDELILIHSEMYSSSDVGFAVPRQDREDVVDNAQTLRYALDGDAASAIVVSIFTNPDLLEVTRGGMYLAKNLTQLRNLIKFINHLRSFMGLGQVLARVTHPGRAE